MKSVNDLDGATICVQPGTTNEVDVAGYFRRHKLTLTPVVIERLEEVTNAYFAGRCDAFSQDQATLAALRERAPIPMSTSFYRADFQRPLWAGCHAE